MAQRGNNIPYEFIAFPVDIFTANPPMTRSELMLIGYLLMQIRFGEKIPTLTDGDLLDGIRRIDGSREDSGCGINNRNSFKEARESLVARGWLEVAQLSRYVRTYKPLIEAFSVTVEKLQSVSESDTQVSESDSRTVKKLQSNDPTNNVLRVKERKEEKSSNGQVELIALPRKEKEIIPLPPIPEWMPTELWEGWMEVRKKAKKVLTPLGYRLALDEFGSWRSQGHDIGDILRTAIKRNWAGFELEWYLNAKGKVVSTKPPAPPDGYALAMEGRKR